MSKILFFPLLAKYSQRARPKRNAYFIHKTISVREKIAQIHTNTQRSYCDVMPLLRMVRNCTTVEWYAASQRLSSHRRVHNKLSRCCTIRIVEYESLWDNLGMSDIMWNMNLFAITLLWKSNIAKCIQYLQPFQMRMRTCNLTDDLYDQRIGLQCNMTSRQFHYSAIKIKHSIRKENRDRCFRVQIISKITIIYPLVIYSESCD